MFEELKETLRRVLLAKYSIGFIDGYETGKADGYTEGYTDGTKAGGSSCYVRARTRAITGSAYMDCQRPGKSVEKLSKL